MQNKFIESLDYQGKTRSASRDRFTNSTARKIDQDLRSTAIAESASNRASTYQQAELDSFLHSCKVKKAILKEKLASAEVKLQDMMRKRSYDRTISTKPSIVSPAPLDHGKLTSNLQTLKQTRAIHNHDLNAQRLKIDRLRATESRLLRQTADLDSARLKLDGRLSAYENLLRENLRLKSKLRTAASVLAGN